MASFIAKIKELGLELPEIPEPIGAYIPAIKVGDLVYTSGILPMLNGKLIYKAEIGGFLNSLTYGYEAAKLCTLNALSIIHNLVGLDNIERIIKVTGYINTASNFSEHPKVLNGASDLLLEIFGESGKHVRSAVGMKTLPMGAAVELEMIVQVK